MTITPGTPGALAILIPQFLQRIQLRGASGNTIAAYRRDLQLLAAYAAQRDVTLVQLVSERLLNRWVDDGLLHQGWSPRTAARRLSAVRSFTVWARGEGYLDHDPTEHVRVRYRTKRVVAPELEPLKAVIAAVGTEDPFDLRDRAVLMLLLDAALRAGEVERLDVPTEDRPAPLHRVDVRAQRVYAVPKGSGGDDADVVGIEPQTAAAVQAWLRVRTEHAEGRERALFVNHSGRRMSRQLVYRMVRRRGAAAGLPNLHPHLFRHRRVGDVVERLGLDMGSALARHRQTSTTANVYGAHAAEVQRAAIRTMAPLGDIACNG